MMRKPIISLLFAMAVMAVSAQTTTILSEGFDEGKPSSAPSSETVVTLASGDWTFKGAYAAKDQSNYRARMNAGGYFILPALDAPTGISFNHRASGSGKTLTVEKSTDGGSSWSAVGEVKPSSASAYGSASFTIGEASATGVLIRFTASAATIFVDNIVVTSSVQSGGDDPTEPDVPVAGVKVSPSSLDFGNVNYTKGYSAIRMLYVQGTSLTAATGTVKVSVKAPFEVSADGSVYASSVEIPFEGSEIAKTGVYVRFTPIANGKYTDEATVAVTGEDNIAVALTGVGTDKGNVYYISPDGDDSGDGSMEHPWYNLQLAVNHMQPGDIVYLRGGTYYPTMTDSSGKTTVRLTANGTADARFTIAAYPGEFPILNFKDQPKKQSIRGMLITGNYWTVEGIHITRAGDNGIKLEGSYNIIKGCTFSYNDDTGLQLGFGHNFQNSIMQSYGVNVSSNDGTWCAFNDIIDCDSYLNCDSDNFGSDADGFACKMHNGMGNRFIRCRAWDNSDDGWDLYETDYAVYLYECWAWGSGRASDFDWVDASGSFQGNGNGIKLGGNGTGGSSKGIHEAWNCIAFNCNKSGSVKGFDQNSHNGGVRVVNCLAFGCGYDFMFEKSSTNCEFYNNICLGRYEIRSGALESNNAVSAATGGGKGGWNPVVTDFSTSDFTSLSEEDAKAARGADGSMPTGFARLLPGSKLIDKGVDMMHDAGLDYSFLVQPICGNGRDLGPYEYGTPDISGEQVILGAANESMLKVVNGALVVAVDKSGVYEVELYTISGTRVYSRSIALEEGAEYTLNPEVSCGIYIARVGNMTAKYVK